uniref:Ig-like domain-containing protein n=1 Tax=Gasterosteus aculeatus TaxID=69293 RepID=G3NGL5_GASAC|nr:uncharacterized protein si:dkey-192g7.3 [Gasterosteus aculeatus aculeatus]
MRTFLGLLMVSMVLKVLSESSDETTIKGVLGHSVLLPCTCKNGTKLNWQWNDTEPLNTSNRYTGRTKTFLSENGNNCSILLANVTSEDQGKYKCCFHNEVYHYSFVHLSVSESEPPTDSTTLNPQRSSGTEESTRFIKVFPIMFVVGLFLFLLYRVQKRRVHQRRSKQTTPDGPTQWS